MQSEQERIVREFSARSTGAPFVFEPTIYSKGSRGETREPCDLAWAINDVVWLVSLKGGRKAFEAKERQSLRQLSGAHRAWRDLHEPLRGANESTTFEIPYDPKAHVVLLSVVAGNDARVRLHPDFARRCGVALAATIPEAILSQLPENAGSSRDLVDLLLAARLSGVNELSTEEAVMSLWQLKRGFWTNAGLEEDYSSNATTIDFLGRMLYEALKLARRWRPKDGSKFRQLNARSSSFDLLAALDDVGWRGSYLVLRAISPRADERRLAPPPMPATVDMTPLNRTVALLRECGADETQVSTIVPPPAGVTWPPHFDDAISIVGSGPHTFVVARLRELASAPLLDSWHRAWRAAEAQAQPGFPPLAVLSWQSELGHQLITAARRGTRNSATHAAISRVRVADA